VERGEDGLISSDLETARLLKRRIGELAPIRRFVIFGSRARGDAEKESDLDIFVEIPEVTDLLRRKIYEAAWEVGFDSGLVISIFLVSPQLLENSLLSANPILHVIETEGIAV
jgi:predicted nucleotidyltransferase